MEFEFDYTELKNVVKSLNKAKITKNRIKLSGGKDGLISKFLDEMELIIDSGLSSNVPSDVVEFYKKLSKEEETTESEVVVKKTETEPVLIQEEVEEKLEGDLDLDDVEIWHQDETLPEEEEEVLVGKSKEVFEIGFDEENNPIYSTMSVFANVMDIYIDNQNIGIESLMPLLKKRGIKTTERYANVRLKHAQDMIALLKKRNMLKEVNK